MKLSYKNIIQCVLISSFAFLLGCDNELPFPEPYEGETIFHVDGQLDNDAIMLEAGIDSFYMYTDLELNNDNILQFSGAFQKNDLCTDICNEKLKIIINNYTNGLDFILDSALFVGNYKLEPTIQTGSSEYIVNFNPIIVGNFTFPITYAWDFGNGNNSTVSNPTTTYDNNGGYNISLTTTEANGQVSTLSDSVSNFLTAPTCSINIDYISSLDSNNGSYNYLMWAIDSIGNSDYSWNIDTGQGGFLAINNQDTITFSIPANLSPFEVNVENSSSDCDLKFSTKLFNQASNNNNYELSLDYNVQNIVTPGDSSFFSMVIIEYTTPNGIFYSSELGNQDGSTFEILNIIDHDNNERDQNTKKIEASVNCKLYNVNGSSLDFISNDLIFGVSTSN